MFLTTSVNENLCRSGLNLENFDSKVPLIHTKPRDFKEIEFLPHVDARQIWVSAFDPVRNGSGENPAFVFSLHHQWSATVALENSTKNIRPRVNEINAFESSITYLL